MGIFSKVFGSYSTRELARIEPLEKKVLELDEEYQALSDADLKEKTNEFRERLEDGESLESMEAEALATVREAAYRVLGKKPLSGTDHRCHCPASGTYRRDENR